MALDTRIDTRTDDRTVPVARSLPGSAPASSAPVRARRARRAVDGVRDVARELPGFPSAHRGAFTVALLAGERSLR